MNNNEYRLMPVKLLPAIRDALVETGKCFQPEHVWAAIIEAFDRAAPCACGEPETADTVHRTDEPCHQPERSETPAAEQIEASRDHDVILASRMLEAVETICAQSGEDVAGMVKWLTNGSGLFQCLSAYYTRPAPAVSSSAAPSDDPMPKRTAFVAWCEGRGLDASVEKDAWGAHIFKNAHIQSMWEGWFNAAPSPTGESLSAPDAWMKANTQETTSADNKKWMENAGFGVWSDVAAQYTRPLYFATPSVQAVAAAGQDKPTAEKAVDRAEQAKAANVEWRNGHEARCAASPAATPALPGEG